MPSLVDLLQEPQEPAPQVQGRGSRLADQLTMPLGKLEVPTEPDVSGPLGFLDGVREVFSSSDAVPGSGLGARVPFVGAGVTGKDYYDLIAASKRVAAGAGTPEDEAALRDFVDHQSRPKTWGYHFASILGDAPTYAVEFLGGAGLYSAGKAGAKKILAESLGAAAEKAAERSLRRKVTDVVGTVITQTAAQGLVGEAIGEGGRFRSEALRLAFQDIGISVDDADQLQVAFLAHSEDWVDKIPEAVRRSLYENASEHMGGALDPLFGVFGGVARAFFRKNPGATPGMFVQAIEKAGIHSVASEVSEEYLNRVMQAADPGMEEDFGDVWQGWEDASVMTAAFAAMRAPAMLADKALGSPTQDQPPGPGGVVEEPVPQDGGEPTSALPPVSGIEDPAGAAPTAQPDPGAPSNVGEPAVQDPGLSVNSSSPVLAPEANSANSTQTALPPEDVDVRSMLDDGLPVEVRELPEGIPAAYDSNTDTILVSPNVESPERRKQLVLHEALHRARSGEGRGAWEDLYNTVARADPKGLEAATTAYTARFQEITGAEPGEGLEGPTRREGGTDLQTDFQQEEGLSTYVEPLVGWLEEVSSNPKRLASLIRKDQDSTGIRRILQSLLRAIDRVAGTEFSTSAKLDAIQAQLGGKLKPAEAYRVAQEIQRVLGTMPERAKIGSEGDVLTATSAGGIERRTASGDLVWGRKGTPEQSEEISEAPSPTPSPKTQVNRLNKRLKKTGDAEERAAIEAEIARLRAEMAEGKPTPAQRHQSRRDQFAGESVRNWIRVKGGLNTTQDKEFWAEFRDINADRKGMPIGTGRLVHPPASSRGIHPDQALEGLIEAGFFPGRTHGDTDLSALRDAIAEDVKSAAHLETQAEIDRLAEADADQEDYNEFLAMIEDTDVPFAVDPAQTETPDFKRWFGDSKVVDGDGKPLVVFHGTSDVFTEFSTDEARDGAIYLTSEPAVAESYIGRSNKLWREASDRERAAHAEFMEAWEDLPLPPPEVEERLGRDESWAWTWYREQADEYGLTNAQVSLMDRLVKKWDAADRDVRRADTDDGSIMPGYVSLQNPHVVESQPWLPWNLVNSAAIETALENGNDGVIIRNSVDTATGEEIESDIYIVFEPTQIKSATGNRGTFDPSNPDIRYAVDDGSTTSGDSLPEGVRKAVDENYSKVKTRKGGLRTKLQDFMLAVREFEKDRGIGSALSTYLGAELWQGKALPALRAANAKFRKPVLDALRKLSDAKVSLESIEEWILARGAVQANALLEERSGVQNGSGMSDLKAQQILAKVANGEHSATFEKLGRAFDAHNKAVRQVWVDKGLETQETVDALEEAWGPHWAPRRTDSEEIHPARIGKGLQVRGKEFKMAQGRSSMADSPLAFTMSDMDLAIVRGFKAEAARRMLSWVQDNPNNGFIKATKLKEKPEGYKDDDLHFTLKDENAQEWRLTFAKEYAEIPRALKRLGVSNLNEYGRAMRTITRTLAGLSTRYNPPFILVNTARDVLTGLSVVGGEQGGQHARDIARSLPSAFKALKLYGKHATEDLSLGEIKAKMDALPLSPKERYWVDALHEYQMSGAPITWFNLGGFEVLREDLKKEFSLAKGDGIVPDWARNVAGNVGGWIEKWTDASENLIRFGTFAHAVKPKDQGGLGMTPDEAASYAKNLTTNFEKKGELTDWINAHYMFANAGIQSVARFMKAIKRPGIRKLLVGVVGGAAIMSAINRAISGDDESGKNYYDQIPDWIKRNNQIIMVPGTEGRYLSIPLPFVFNWFHSVGVSMEGYALGSRSLGETAGSVSTGMLDAFNPLGGAGNPMEIATPTVLDPVLQHVTNKDWAGNPIARMPYFNQKTSAANLPSKSASGPAKLLARLLNTVSGGDEVEGGFLDISPDVIDHYVGFVTGGLGKSGLRLLTTVESAAKGEVPLNKDIPVVRRFLGARSPYRISSTFWDYVEEIETVEARIKVAEDRGDIERVRELRSENRALLSLSSRLRRVRAQVKRLKNAEGDPERVEELLLGFNQAYAERMQ